MPRRFTILLVLIIILLAACNKPIETPSGADGPDQIAQQEEDQSTDTPAPTDLPTAQPTGYWLFEPLDPDYVALDFTEDICSAAWSTNASQLPCPINLDEVEGAYVEMTGRTVVEGNVSVEAPTLIGLPGKGYPQGLGLFGKYPPFTVYPGDVFHATIACQGDADCDLGYALEYFDEQGNYQSLTYQWDYQRWQGPLKIEADLSALAGQTVEFLLVMRTQDEPEDQWGVWIQPHIARDPDAQPLPTQEIIPTATPDPTNKTPGVISGMVDMGPAPPYLKSSYGDTASSSPVAVVFFNLTDGTYWWIHTSLTGHPYFQMTITPGDYHVVAYAPGVGDVPYVAAGYTGQNPSCGKNLKTVTMEPNGRLENIVVSDWNWTCGSDAYRPPKPGGVPLP
jgi:hypothetical protein